MMRVRQTHNASMEVYALWWMATKVLFDTVIVQVALEDFGAKTIAH
jgi:hypothetical protein